MSKLSTTKGKTFERKIAAIIRERWPDAMVVRASQGERAHNSDVFIECGPPMLTRLWLECQDSRSPTPRAKLEQAERDIGGSSDPSRIPVVIWHRLGCREIDVMTRLWVLDALRGPLAVRTRYECVAMRLEDFLDLLDQTRAGKEAE